MPWKDLKQAADDMMTLFNCQLALLNKQTLSQQCIYCCEYNQSIFKASLLLSARAQELREACCRTDLVPEALIKDSR